MQSFQQLPVSSEQVDRTTFVWGLPHELPNVPNIQLSQNMQNLLPLVVGYLRKELQDNVDKSAARRFLYNIMSQNHFQNNEFAEGVRTLSEYAEMIMLSQPQLQQNPEQVLAQCAVETATILSCVYAKKYPALLNQLSQQARQDIDVWLGKYNQIAHAVEQMHMQQGGMPMQQGGGMNMAQNNPRQMGHQTQWQQPQQQGPMNPMMQQGYNQPQMPMGMQQPQQPQMGWNQPQQPQQWQQVGPQGMPMQQPQMNMGYNQPQQQPMQQMQMGGGPVQRPHFPQGHQRTQFGGNDMFQMGGQGNQQGGQGHSGGGGVRTALKARSSQKNQQPADDDLRQTPPGNAPGYVMEEFGSEGYSDFRNDDQRQNDAANRPTPGELGPRDTLPGMEAKPQTAQQRFTQAMDNTPQQPAQPSQPAPVDNDTPYYGNPERPFDQFVYQGREFRPAFKSGWTKSFSLEQPYRVAYNPQKEILFHVMDAEGNVAEVLQEIGEGMDYLQHELNSELRQVKSKRDLENGPKIVPSWDILEDPLTVEQKEEIPEDKEVDIKAGKKPLVLPEILQAHSFNQAKMLHEIRLVERGVTGDNLDIPMEFYYQETTPVKVNGVDREETAKVIMDLRKSESVTSLLYKLEELHGKIDSTLWNMIHDRLTNRLNEIMAHNLQLITEGEAWSVDSIVDDWEELRGALKEEFGDEGGAGLFKSIEKIGRKDLIEGTVGVLIDNDLNDYIDGLEVSDETREELDKSLVVFTENVSITHVPWSLDDSTVQLDPHGSVILDSRFPELYSVIKAIHERTSKTSLTFRHRYIETSDGSLYELHRGYLVKDSYLMHQVR